MNFNDERAPKAPAPLETTTGYLVELNSLTQEIHSLQKQRQQHRAVITLIDSKLETACERRAEVRRKYEGHGGFSV